MSNTNQTTTEVAIASIEEYCYAGGLNSTETVAAFDASEIVAGLAEDGWDVPCIDQCIESPIELVQQVIDAAKAELLES